MAFSNHISDFTDFLRLPYGKMLWNSDFFEETFIQIFEQSDMRLNIQ